MTTPDYDTDFYAWTQAQAAAIRAHAWNDLDVEHVAEEIEDLCNSDGHHLAMLVLGFLEVMYQPCGHEEGHYYWQWAAIDHGRDMLTYSLEESPRVRPILESQLQDAYTWAREQVMRRRNPPRSQPPEGCPWTMAARLDERWWPSDARHVCCELVMHKEAPHA